MIELQDKCSLLKISIIKRSGTRIAYPLHKYTIPESEAIITICMFQTYAQKPDSSNAKLTGHDTLCFFIIFTGIRKIKKIYIELFTST